MGLYLYGEKTQAHITYSEKASYGRRSGGSYRVHYEFTLPDNSLQTGSSRMSIRGGSEPSGWMNIRYFSFRPDFNKPDGASIIVFASFWFLPGIGLIIYSIIRMRKKKLSYERLDRISGEKHSESTLSNFISVLVLLAIGTGLTYFLFIQLSQPKQTKGSEIISTQYGNTQGNVSNGGIATRDGDNIYFANFTDAQKLYSMKADGSGVRKLTDESVNCINFYDGWIYYCNFNDSDKIYKIKPDGTGKSRVYKWKSQDVNISGGWFFLSNGNDHNRIYRVRVNGKNELQLNNDESNNLSVAGGWIYYTNETDWKKLYRIRTDGSQRTAATDFAVTTVIADETGVFFTSADEGLLYRLDNNKTTPVKLIDRKVGMYNIADGKIYYADDDRFLYVMNQDGSEAKQLNQVNSWFISTLGEKVMVVDFTGSDYNYLIDVASGTTQEIH